MSSNLKLTEEEWRVLQSTDIAHGASLVWSCVCMAQWDRSLRSAKAKCLKVQANDFSIDGDD